MSFVKNFIGFILMLVAVPILTFASCNLAIDNALRSESTYKEAFASESVFENLVPVTLPAILEAVTITELNEIEQALQATVDLRDLNRLLNREDWVEISNALVPSDWLRQTYNRIVEIALSLIRGDEDARSAQIDVSELRQRFSEERIEEVTELILTKLPACNQTQSDQLRAFEANSTNQLVEIPLCLPSEEQQAIVSGFIANWFTNIGENLATDSIVVGDFITADDARLLKLLFEIDTQVLVLAFLCPISIFALIITVAVRSGKGFMRWTGITTLLSGLLVIGALVAAQLIVLSSLSALFDVSGGIEGFFAQVVSSLFRSVISQASSLLLLQSAFYVITGFTLLVLATFINAAPAQKALTVGETVLITEDGEIISTASKKR